MFGFGDFGDEDFVLEDFDWLGGEEDVLVWVLGKEVSLVVSAALLDFIVDEEGTEFWDHSEK